MSSSIINHSDHNEDDGRCNLANDMDAIKHHKKTEMYTVVYEFFQKGNHWDWGKYCTNRDEDVELHKKVSKDYIPVKGPILSKHKAARLDHMRQLGERISPNSGTTLKTQMTNDLKKFKATVRVWITSFFVEFTQYAGIFYQESNGNKRKIKSMKELEHVQKQFKSKEEVVNYYCMLYFPFDYMDDYIEDIADYAMRQHRLRLDPVLVERENDLIANSDGTKRHTVTNFQRLVSVIVNEVRQKIKDKIKNYTCWSLP
jgi:hypothetical protein